MFSLKTIIYGILSSEMLRENHAVLGGGGGYRFPQGGGGSISVFEQNIDTWWTSIYVTVPVNGDIVFLYFWMFETRIYTPDTPDSNSYSTTGIVGYGGTIDRRPLVSKTEFLSTVWYWNAHYFHGRNNSQMSRRTKQRNLMRRNGFDIA
jgi:hypothetical protein